MRTIQSAIDERVAKLEQLRELVPEPIVQSAIDEQIAKLKQLRELLSTPAITSFLKETLVKDVFGEDDEFSPNSAPQILIFVDPGVLLQLLANPDGTSRNPDVHLVVPSDKVPPKPRAATPTKTGTEGPAEIQATAPPTYRSAMTQAAYESLRGIHEPFSASELIDRMKAAGFKFASHPEISIQNSIRRLLKSGVLQIAAKGAGRRPTAYTRKEESTDLKAG
jgi:hypothetical protein